MMTTKNTKGRKAEKVELLGTRASARKPESKIAESCTVSMSREMRAAVIERAEKKGMRFSEWCQEAITHYMHAEDIGDSAKQQAEDIVTSIIREKFGSPENIADAFAKVLSQKKPFSSK